MFWASSAAPSSCSTTNELNQLPRNRSHPSLTNPLGGTFSAPARLGGQPLGWMDHWLPRKARPKRPALHLLWMNGGPSTIYTLTRSPDTPTARPQAIGTKVPGVRLARYCRSRGPGRQTCDPPRMNTKEADHGAQLPIRRAHRAARSATRRRVDSSARNSTADANPCWSASPRSGCSAPTYGRLRPARAPPVVAEHPSRSNPARTSPASACGPDLPNGVPPTAERPTAPSASLDDSWPSTDPPGGHHYAYTRANTHEAAVKSLRPTEGKTPCGQYGRSLFGQCRRQLVEGPFVITLSSAPGVKSGIGWDTHVNSFDAVRGLFCVLDGSVVRTLTT